MDVCYHALPSLKEWSSTSLSLLVSRLRSQRKGMIQTPKQYKMIYDFLYHLVK